MSSADETLPRMQAADRSPLLRELGRAKALGARSRELVGRVAGLRRELRQAVAVLSQRRRECAERRAGAHPPPLCVLVALGAARVFEKPFRLDELVAELSRLCGRGAGGLAAGARTAAGC